MEFKIKEYCNICKEYEDLNREKLEERINNIIEELEEEEEKEIFKNKENLSSVLMKIPMKIAREELKNRILDMLYGKEEK